MICRIYMDERCRFWLVNSDMEKNERIGAFSTFEEITNFLEDSGIKYSKDNQLQICKDLVYKYEIEKQIAEDQRFTFTYNWGVPDAISIECYGSNARIIARAYELYPDLKLDDEQLVKALNEDIPVCIHGEWRKKCAEAYSHCYYANERIEFFKTENSELNIECGQRGTVLKVLSNGFIDVKWDNGQRIFVNPFRDSICPLTVFACREEAEAQRKQEESEILQTDENEIEETDEGPAMSM